MYEAAVCVREHMYRSRYMENGKNRRLNCFHRRQHITLPTENKRCDRRHPARRMSLTMTTTPHPPPAVAWLAAAGSALAPPGG